MRRLASVVAVVALGLLTIMGTATANPSYAPATITAVYNGGNEFTVTMGNFGTPSGADSSIALTVTYGAPSGLRRSVGLVAAAKAEAYSFVPNSDGNVTAVVRVSQSGEIFFAATGSPSGDKASTSVFLASSSSGKGSGAVDQQSDSSDLASTGASIAGPIAIGVTALIAGLALLFFGTRGVARRRSVKSE